VSPPYRPKGNGPLREDLSEAELTVYDTHTATGSALHHAGGGAVGADG